MGSNGEVVHVDFNCLFSKGETFDIPERVPFRLTRNLVSAFGAAGCEGPFKKSCEVAMQVLRDECDTLISVLQPFLYDPLVEWNRKSGAGDRGRGESRNVQANKEIVTIK